MQWLAVSSDKGTVHVFNLKVNLGLTGNDKPRPAPDLNIPAASSSLSFIKVKTFHAETGMSKKVPKWKQLPGAAKQPGGHECGYYVMRDIKEIIEDEELSFPRKWALKNRKQYIQEEFDEVRIEVSDYLGTIM